MILDLQRGNPVPRGSDAQAISSCETPCALAYDGTDTLDYPPAFTGGLDGEHALEWSIGRRLPGRWAIAGWVG
jgi:hypothetical protein